jgi:carbon storage regulator
MLVIRCREGESISIGDDIEVTVLAASAGKVKLGFKAPVSVPVARRCVELTRRQNHAAVHGTDGSLIDSLASYLNYTEPNNLSCIVSLQLASDSSEEPRKNERRL